MINDLTKSQKKIARELIEKGLQSECRSFLEKMEKLTHKPNWEKESPHELYLKLYKKVHSFDKHIAYHYNGMTGSHYFNAVTRLYIDGILSLEDIERFDDDVKNKILAIEQLRAGFS